MRKLVISLLFLLLVLTMLVSAVDFVPSGDINGRGIYAIKNFTNITAVGKICFRDGFCFNSSNFSAGGGGGSNYTAGLGLNLTGTTFNVNETYLSRYNDTALINSNNVTQASQITAEVALQAANNATQAALIVALFNANATLRADNTTQAAQIATLVADNLTQAALITALFNANTTIVTRQSADNSTLTATKAATGSVQCAGTDQVYNITLTSTGLAVQCSAQGSGGGMTSWTLSNGTATAVITDGERVNITGGRGILIGQVDNQLVINSTVVDTNDTTALVALDVREAANNVTQASLINGKWNATASNTSKCDPTTEKIIQVNISAGGVLIGECGTDQSGAGGGSGNVTSQGSGGFIPLFNNATSLNNSLLSQVSTSSINLLGSLNISQNIFSFGTLNITNVNSSLTFYGSELRVQNFSNPTIVLKETNNLSFATMSVQNDQALQVTFSASGSNRSGSGFSQNLSNLGRIFFAGGNGVVGTFNSNNLSFGTNNTEYVRILENGNIGVRTKTPTVALDINGSLTVQGNITAGSGVSKFRVSNNGTLTTITGTDPYVFNQTVTVKKLSVSNYTNAGTDRCTLVGGTCTISNTQVTSNTNIICYAQTSGGTPGFTGISARVAATSYTITGIATDTSIMACILVEPDSVVY